MSLKKNMDSSIIVVCVWSLLKMSQIFSLKKKYLLGEAILIKTSLSPIDLKTIWESHISSHWCCRSYCFQGNHLGVNFQNLHLLKLIFTLALEQNPGFSKCHLSKNLEWDKVSKFLISKPRSVLFGFFSSIWYFNLYFVLIIFHYFVPWQQGQWNIVSIYCNVIVET